MKKILFTILFLLSLTHAKAQLPDKISMEDKLFGASTFWNEVNQNFVYLDKLDYSTLETDYKQLLKDILETKNDYEYYRLLEKFCATLKDGHTNVYMPEYIDDYLGYQSFGTIEFRLKNIENKMIISKINESAKNEFPIGTEILKINDLDIKEYQEKYTKPYISSSTTYILENWSASKLFYAPYGTEYKVEFLLPNKTTVVKELVLHKSTDEELIPKDKSYELLEYKWLENNTLYIALNSFDTPKIVDEFKKIIFELPKAKSFIIDLRNNGGGNTNNGFQILQYFTKDEKLNYAKMSSRKTISAYKAWGKYVEAKDTINNASRKEQFLTFHNRNYYEFPKNEFKIDKNIPRFVKPTVVLISNNTASAAEDFLVSADNQEHFTKIGQPTFGSTGQPVVFDLPNGGEARVCTKKDTYPDGREFVAIGILPDIEVKQTIIDFLNRKDVALEKALEYLKSKK